MDFRRTEAYRPRMRQENEEVDVEEVAAAKPWRERRGGGLGGWVVAGDALKRCLSGDVSYPRECALVNRRGRLGVASATPQPRSPNCRLARLSVLYLNTWRICSLGRCLLPLYVRDGERTGERTSRPALFSIFVSVGSSSPSVSIPRTLPPSVGLPHESP